ncbi:DUF6101 family protein [Pleomorphomonas sp. JP5]|uniref:DUF6101 family protein n=1 Tax=Pleomorphomonas sp. JP5 TaxID=2942998 RepID=UPI002042EAFD|nr:DUF6101 family protein [Pleomorphomonas sp. JP5]MCM5559059.1 DUF6101 family protein [Pleomorphomonas sp. JP5]
MMGATPLGLKTALRLDPGHLPAKWCVNVGQVGRPVQEAAIYMDDDGVVVRRQLSGLPLTLSLPFTAFEGVSVRIEPNAAGDLVANVELHHRDPALSIPLTVTRDMEAAAADWKGWSDRLGLPMLLVSTSGSVERVGSKAAVPVGDPAPRRRHASMGDRRPRFLVRRKMGAAGEMPVLRDWREIISYE